MRKIKTPFLLLGVLLWCNFCSSANIFKRCSSAEVLERQLKADPDMKFRMEEIEQFTNSLLKNSAHRFSYPPIANMGAVITIPVVVHVLYNNNVQNVSDAMILSQLDVLNKDYSATNPDRDNVPSAFASSVANTYIQFCLAKRDPSGSATTGIIRKATSTVAFADDDKVKNSATGGDNAWDASKYLNIWICNMANGILGYAQFPGGPSTTDGVVLLYSSLPGGTSIPYNKGRTATHEVGHWLNLRHLWGDAFCGNDQVADTPPQQTANFGCPSFPHLTCSNNGDMFMNYMDYTDDACMYMFTPGQSARLNALFATGGARVSMLTSNGCEPPSPTACAMPSAINTTAITSTGATLSWGAVSGAVSYTIQYKTSAAIAWTTTTSTLNSKAITGLAANTSYNYKIQAVCSSPGTYTAAATFKTLPVANCATPSGINAGSITASAVVLSWNAVSGAAKYNVQYKPASAGLWTTVTSAVNNKTLTGLSAGTVYHYKVQALCSSTGTYSGVASFTTLQMSSGCSDGYETNNSYATAATIMVNADIKAQISSFADMDWYKFTNSATSPNIKVTLSNLPKDYDLELYNASGIFLIMSDNAGTSPEGIVYNGAPVGTYFIRVLGYGGVSSSSCYTLKAQNSTTALREMEAIESKSAVNKDGKVSVYPNPSSGDFTIRYLSETDTKITFTVYDLSGKAVRSDTFDAVKGENLKLISLPDVGNGLYLIDLNDGKERKMYKVVINK